MKKKAANLFWRLMDAIGRFLHFLAQTPQLDQDEDTKGTEMNKVKCPNCGKPNPGDARKCIYCGAPLK